MIPLRVRGAGWSDIFANLLVIVPHQVRRAHTLSILEQGVRRAFSASSSQPQKVFLADALPRFENLVHSALVDADAPQFYESRAALATAIDDDLVWPAAWLAAVIPQLFVGSAGHTDLIDQFASQLGAGRGSDAGRWAASTDTGEAIRQKGKALSQISAIFEAGDSDELVVGIKRVGRIEILDPEPQICPPNNVAHVQILDRRVRVRSNLNIKDPIARVHRGVGQLRVYRVISSPDAGDVSRNLVLDLTLRQIGDGLADNPLVDGGVGTAEEGEGVRNKRSEEDILARRNEIGDSNLAPLIVAVEERDGERVGIFGAGPDRVVESGVGPIVVERDGG